MKFLNNIDLNLNQLLNVRLQNLASDITPASGNTGQLYFNTVGGVAKLSNGTTLDTVTNVLESVSIGTANGLSVAAVSSKNQAISLALASGSVAGALSTTFYNLLNGATTANTASTLVERDGSGNFSAGTITAALTGTASNASQLNSQAASYYLARANHTGTQLAATISDFDTQVRTSRLDQLAAPTAAVSMNSQRLSGLADPTSAQDAATKNYVDASAAGYDTKASAKLATAAALPANTYSAGVLTATGNAALTVDGTAVAVGDRVLVKNEATAANNGLYVVTATGSGAAAYVLTRTSDANANSGTGNAALNPGSFVFIETGTANAATAWVMTTTGTITIGSTSIAWTQVGSPTTYTAGNGISLASNTISAKVDTTTTNANSLSVSSNGLTVSATYVGQTSITTLGTITSGTWTGTAIAVANGGTGGTTAAAAKTNLGFTTKATGFTCPASTTWTITHNLGTQDVALFVRDSSTNAMVEIDWVATSSNVVTATFAVAPTAAAYTAVVFG